MDFGAIVVGVSVGAISGAFSSYATLRVVAWRVKQLESKSEKHDDEISHLQQSVARLQARKA